MTIADFLVAGGFVSATVGLALIFSPGIALVVGGVVCVTAGARMYREGN